MDNEMFALGLDLGISQCRISLFKNNAFEIIPDDKGHLQIPTCIAFNDTKILIGEEAKSQLIDNP